jgi:hypothetical protein
MSPWLAPAPSTVITSRRRLGSASSLSECAGVTVASSRMQLPLVGQHPEVADHLGAVSDRAGQVRGDPAPVVDQQPRRGQRS